MRFQHIVRHGILALSLLIGAPSYSQQPIDKFNQLKFLKLKRGTIKVGMVSDKFIKIVLSKEIVSQVVKPDPLNPGSLVVRKECKVGNTNFTVLLARDPDPGPYRIIAILTKKQ